MKLFHQPEPRSAYARHGAEPQRNHSKLYNESEPDFSLVNTETLEESVVTGELRLNRLIKDF